MAHPDARTTVYARMLMVERYLWPSGRGAHRRAAGRLTSDRVEVDHPLPGRGLRRVARSIVPTHTSPTRTAPAGEAQILALHSSEGRGAVYLAGELGLVASTVGRVLARQGRAAPERDRPDHRPYRDGGGTPGSATSTPDLGIRSTSTSRSWVGSPTGVAGGCTGAASRSGAAATATTSSASSSTSRSMTTPASPASRRCPTNGIPAAPSSATARSPGSASVVCGYCGS